MSNKQKNKNTIHSDKARKMLLASMAVATAVGAEAIVTSDVEKAEAAEVQYYWSKYENGSDMIVDPSFSTPRELRFSKDSIGPYAPGYKWHVGAYDGSWRTEGTRVDSGLDVRRGTVLYHAYTGVDGNSLIKYVVTDILNEEYSNPTYVGDHYSYNGIALSFVDIKGDLIRNDLKAGINAYRNGVKNPDGFWYERGGIANSAPTTPTLTIPTTQFEHGDQHIIGFNSTDTNGDAITYTLEASYNKGSSWSQLYKGTAKTFKYTVPNNQTQVQFRVVASDGQATSAYATSTNKSIREVMYFWSKFNIDGKIFDKYREPYSYTFPEGVWGGMYSNDFESYSSFAFDEKKGFYGVGTKYVTKVGSKPPDGTYIVFSSEGATSVTRIEYTFLDSSGYWLVNTSNITTYPIYKEGKGTLIVNNIQAGLNAYTPNVKNPDGFWYERGQRVLAADTTPPIIELSEQADFNLTSTVTVKTHDLGTVSSVKWAKGNQEKGYFATNGTVIGIGQVTPSSFTASENGEYTVYAVDNKGNATVEVINVTKVNTKPEISSANLKTPFAVIDETTSFNVIGAAFDPDRHSMTVSASHKNATGTAQVVNGQFDITINGSDYTNGLHANDIQITPNDGFADGKTFAIKNPVVIRVNDAQNYNEAMTSHDTAFNDWTPAQHAAFYHAYESIFSYEVSRTPVALTDAQTKINTLKTSVGITESETLTEWSNRIDLVTATVATETAEQSLVKGDYEHAQALVDALVDSTDKDSLVLLTNELQRYHVAKDALNVMKNDPTIVSWDLINEAQGFINVVENTTNKKNLQKELTAIIKKFMSNISTITPEDLENFEVENVDPDLGDIYDEYLDVFQPPAGDEETWAQDLVDFVNALNKALQDVTPSAVSTLHANVPSYATAALQPVTDAVDSLLDYRQSFLRETTKDANLSSLVQAVSFGLTNDYMITMVSAMQEVIEYNVTHDETEKAEGQAAILSLRDGQLKVDMQAYLDNGIPEIIIVEDPYEYINGGSFTVLGSIQDSNDSTHEVEVTFGGVTKTTTANGTFIVTFDGLSDGVHIGDIAIDAKDALTKKSYTITTKPVITVSNAELFKQFGQALSNDLTQTFDVLDTTIITSLKTIFDDTTSISIDSSERKIRDIENAAQTLSGQEEGELETLVKSIFLNIRLDWLINNYKTANAEDFAWAGVVGVDSGNIADLKSIIDDYVAQFTDSPVVTPGLADYQEWLTLQEMIAQARADIETAELLFTSKELSESIANAEASLTAIPDWITTKQDLQDRLDAIKNYYDALISVETAETTYTLADKDAAQDLIDGLPSSTAKDGLQNRLDVVQTVINAIIAVELAESTLDEADQLAAQDLVDVLADDHPMKPELQNRLDSISYLNNAIAAVEQAETSYTQADKNAAQELVDALADGPKKAELESRLDEVQKVLDAIDAVAQAESSLVVEDILDAQTKVDAIADDNPIKAELQNKLDAIEGLRATIEAVTKAETTYVQADKDAAQDLVDVLPDGESKNALQERLDDVQKVIDALEAIEIAENTLTDEDLSDAQAKVDAIDDANPIKEDLQNRLDAVGDLKDAIGAVDNAESTLSQADKDAAQDLVNVLPDSPKKDELQNRLDELQDVLDKLNAEEKATDAVEVAENTFSQADKDAAQDLVNELEVGPIKDGLQDRLDDLQNVLDSIVDIESAVAAAELSKAQADVDTAQLLLDAVPGSDIKSALQDRLDEVNRFITAEKAVTKAEENHFQRVKDDAQALVNPLKEEAAKQGLQDRLDALQAILDGKTNDLLDDIINNPSGVTPGDLADYTDETVYEELMPDYMDEIDKIGESITKDQVIEVVRLINALEIAKRSMLIADIQAYANELSITTLPTKGNYPQPAVLSAINKYVQDDSELDNVITLIATELNRSPEEIRDEITAILDGSANQLAGFYTVIYQTEAGEVIHTDTVENVDFGLVDVQANIPEGFIIIGEAIHSFELTKENKGYEVIFTVTEDVAETGEYTVKYQLEDGTLVSESVETAAYGELTVTAELPDGYALVNDESALQDITFEKDSVLEVIFIVKEVDEVAMGTYSVQYVLEDLSVVAESTLTSNYGEVIVTAAVPDGYSLLDTEVVEKSFELDEATEGTVIQFIVQPSVIDEPPTEEDDTNGEVIPGTENEETDTEIEGDEEVNETPSETPPEENPEVEIPSDETPEDIVDGELDVPETIISDKLDGDTAFVRSLMQVASLDNLYLTATPYVANANQYSAVSEDHAEYLYKTLYALASVKAYLDNPTEDYKTDVVAYITPNLHDGAFKKLLLDYLGVAITDIGDDGEPDLTPVHPTKPIEPPTVPPTVPTPPIIVPDEGTTGNPDPWTPPVVDVEKPSIEIPAIPNGETEAVTEKVEVADVEGGYEWTIENPTEKTYTLKADGIEIVVPLELEALKWEIKWTHIGNEHYQLSVVADGKAVTTFEKPIIVTKKHDDAYLLRSENGEYNAIPYSYNGGKFKFDTNRTGEFYFSTEKVTFKDIRTVYSKDAIEELASRHIVYGTNPNTYSPNAKLTRAQFAAMLTRSLGLEATDSNTPFKDTKGKWFEKDVQALYEAGIIRGTSATTFNPNAYITRQQAASMLEKVLAYREAHVYIAYLGSASTTNDYLNSSAVIPNAIASTFDDSYQIADYAKNAVGLLQTLGVFTGKEGNKFDPQGYLTRAQMAKILTGTLKYTDKF